MILNLDFSSFPALETERLHLAEPQLSDIDDLFEMRSNSQLMQFIPRPVAQNVQDVVGLITMMRTKLEQQEGINWGVYDKETSKLIGILGYVRILKECWRGEIGYILHQDYHGKGLLQEAMQMVIRFGFEKIGFHSIEAVIMEKNKPSIRAVEKNKFQKEAYFKEYQFHRGEFVDTLVYSLLKKDWEKINH